jgi:mannose-6-phosphate isomerase-like protein (cupin superfamily)
MKRAAACVAGTLAFAAVATAADWVGPGADGAAARRDLDAALAANPLASGENIKVVQLFRGERAAQLLVQIRDREPVHYHDDSDISVVMLRGRGTVHVGGDSFAVKAGDALYIRRGVVHYFVNEGKEPAAALVTYSPPPGPNDRVLVESPASGH